MAKKQKNNGDQFILFEPDSEWTEPTELPVIPRGLEVAIDTETRDDGLSNNRGPGWVFNDGYMVGFSVAWRVNRELHCIYIPLRHPDSKNWPIDEAIKWLKKVIEDAERIVFQNGAYDMGWLSTEGVYIPDDKIEDTHAMAVMVDENRLSYKLDALCTWRGVRGKDEQKLREAAAAFGVDPKAELWKLPARHVGGYGAQDAASTLELYESLREEILSQGLEEAYRLEMDLLPMVMAMRKRGIRIDEDQADITMQQLRLERDKTLSAVARNLGWSTFTMDHALSPVSLEQAFDQEQVPYTRTPKTKKGSFKSDWMNGHDHWLPSLVSKARKLNDLSEKFIGTYILDAIHLGRVHAEVHQLRDDDSGTRSYRLSYSNPPLQQMPARDAMAWLIRSIFLPERDTLWASGDYSQQEPRMAVHFAALADCTGADTAVSYYLNNPDADFHDMVAELTGVPRKKAKIINLGLMYGMGIFKLAISLGVTMDEAKDMVAQYNERMPFIKSLTEFCTRRANTRGYIRLLDGARSRFDMYEPAYREDDEIYKAPMPHAEALVAWEGKRLRRAFTHKSMNRLIQGSAARQTKKAMREAYRAGLLPLIQMHDELGTPISNAADGKRFAEIMRDVVTLKVPMKVDLQYGWNWGQASQEVDIYKKADLLSFKEVFENKGKTNKEIFEMRPNPMVLAA